MQTQKVSISLSDQQYNFIESYKVDHHYKSRSEVIKKALSLLQQGELEACYREANSEIDEAWEVTVADGLDDAAW